MFKTTNYFLNSAYSFMPTSYHLAVILRSHGSLASGPLDGAWLTGRGIIIGNTHRVAENLSSPACNQAAMSQIEIFGGGPPNNYQGTVYEQSCLSDQLRYLDGRWYRVTVSVNDSKLVKYSVDETDVNGNVVANLVTNVALTAAVANDPPNNLDGFSLVSTGRFSGGSYRPEDLPAFSIEIKNLAVTWL